MQDLIVGGIQADIIWSDKAANFSKYEKLIDQLPIDCQVIVLPEMFQTGFQFDRSLAENMEDSPTLNWLKNQAFRRNAVVVGSLMMRENGALFNRLIWMNPSGDFTSYDKRHLFSMSDEPKYFTPGNSFKVIDHAGWKIGLAICYDLRFPVWLRNKSGYDLLILLANWPQKRSHHWSLLLRARAIENQSYVLGVNRFGIDGNGFFHDGMSAVINPLGDYLVEPCENETVFTARLNHGDLETIRCKMPFLKDADNFHLG